MDIATPFLKAKPILTVATGCGNEVSNSTIGGKQAQLPRLEVWKKISILCRSSMKYALLCHTETFELTYNSTTFGQAIPKGRASIAFNYHLFMQAFMMACELSFN